MFASACGYADGCCTIEEAILNSYARGYNCVKLKHKLTKGLMVAVGLSTEDLQKILPDGIYIACYNSSSSVTISGPEEVTRIFMEKLQAKGIFAKPVNTGNFAFHSKYIKDVANAYLKHLKEIIVEPKPRSSKWLSTSVPLDKQSETWARYYSPEYHSNNSSSAVLFDCIYEKIPENAIVIEIAPHGLMQSILKKELNNNVTNISLVNRASSNNEEFLLSAIGR